MTGIYKLAGLIISISSLYKEVHIMCAAYRADPEDGAPVFEVSTAKADVEREREKQAREDAFEGLPVQEYSDEYLETLAVYRKIAEKLPFFNCFLFHGSVVAVNGKGYLFTAKSGTGKSTHTRLWRELLGEAAFMINDDKPFLCVLCKGGGNACIRYPVGRQAPSEQKCFCSAEGSLSSAAFARKLDQGNHKNGSAPDVAPAGIPPC